MIRALHLVIWISMLMTVSTYCFEQGTCADGYMDISRGMFKTKADYSYCPDCYGGSYYMNSNCKCACVQSEGCESSSDELMTIDEGLLGIRWVYIAATFIGVMVLIVCITMLCANSGIWCWGYCF